MTRIIFKVGGTDSVPMEVHESVIGDYIAILDEMFPGQWSVRSASKLPEYLTEYPVEEVEPADPRDWDDYD